MPLPTRPYRPCPECARSTNRLSGYCAVHEQRKYRHGSPTARGITHEKLAPYVVRARHLLAFYGKTDGVNAAHELMNDIVTTFGIIPIHFQAGHGTRARPHLDTLIERGATANDCLATVVAVFLLWAATDAQPTADESDLALANRLLLTKPVHMVPRNKGRAKFSRTDALHLGRRIRSELGPFCLALARHDEDEYKRRKQLIKQASAFTLPDTSR